MNNLTSVLICILTVVSCLIITSCSDGEISLGPEDIAREYVETANAGHAEKAADYWEARPDESHIASTQELFEKVSFETSNIQTKRILQTAHQAIVNASYKVTASGNASDEFDEDIELYMVMVEDSGKWLIRGIYLEDSIMLEITQHQNVQLAVNEMMADSDVTELDKDYTGIDTIEEILNVTAQNGSFNLSDYLFVSDALTEAYDIDLDGTVTPTPIPALFTEFYCLGPDGKAEGYPNDIIVNQQTEVLLGVVNRESVEMSYKVEITIDGVLVSQIGPFKLNHKDKWESMVHFTPQQIGINQKVEFLLYKNVDTLPDSTLHLWVDVYESSDTENTSV